MDIQQIAHRLVELLRQKSFLEAQRELFADHARNQEPEGAAAPSVVGLSAILSKEEHFLSRIKEWHQLEVSEPAVGDRYFSVQMLTEVTREPDRRIRINEIIVYQVAAGKIVSEQFFY